MSDPVDSEVDVMRSDIEDMEMSEVARMSGVSMEIGEPIEKWEESEELVSERSERSSDMVR